MSNLIVESPPSALVRLFRSFAVWRFEYSFGPMPYAYGVMVGGQGDDFARRVRQFAERLEFARSWAPFAERFGSLASADLLYFKFDQENDRFSRLTIYGRYLEPIGCEMLQCLQEELLPIQWTGPSPVLLAELLDTVGLIGIGFEISRNGYQNLSLYFEIRSDPLSFCRHNLAPAFESWGWSKDVLMQVAQDVQRLFPLQPIGPVAIEVDEKNSLIMKLDAHRVPFRKALAFLQAKGLALGRQQALLRSCQRLRCNIFNYVGIAYDKTGFKGWKVYVEVRPGDQHWPAGLRII